MNNNANIMIDNLINTIKLLIDTNNNLGKFITKPIMLIEGLTDLKNMIEMDNIKLTIIEQVKLLITNKSQNQSDHSHMLHCVISGKPGQGKTTVAKILGKIWCSLNIIKKPDTKKLTNNYTDILENEIIKYDLKLNKLNKGLITQSNIIKNLKKNNKPDRVKSIIKDLKFNNDTLINIIDIDIENEQKEEIYEMPFIIATRDMLVGSYVGHTAPKTKAVLESALGGILFIDEAYSLFNGSNGSKDSFGEECLNVINEFMSLRSSEIIIIFAGYKDLLLNTIFKVQQGLHRRCMWFFEIEDYSVSALGLIFKKQLEQNNWVLDDNININKFFNKYKNVITNAGDTEKLVYQSKIAYAEYHFDNTLENKINYNNIITYDILLSAIKKIIRNNSVETKNEIPKHMYL